MRSAVRGRRRGHGYGFGLITPVLAIGSLVLVGCATVERSGVEIRAGDARPPVESVPPLRVERRVVAAATTTAAPPVPLSSDTPTSPARPTSPSVSPASPLPDEPTLPEPFPSSTAPLATEVLAPPSSSASAVGPAKAQEVTPSTTANRLPAKTTRPGRAAPATRPRPTGRPRPASAAPETPRTVGRTSPARAATSGNTVPIARNQATTAASVPSSSVPSLEPSVEPTSSMAVPSSPAAPSVFLPDPRPATNAASSRLPTPGFDGKVIRLGVVSTTTHPVWGQIGKALNAGTQARVAAINRRGGIGGKYPVELIVSDANYDSALTAQAIERTKNDVVGYVSILGTPNVEAVEGQLRSEQILAGAASQEARWSLLPHLLPIFNTYQVQAINGIAYFVDNAPPNPTICSLSVATSYGEAGVEGLRFAKTKLAFGLGPAETLPPLSTNVAPALGSLRAAGCAAVLLVTTPQQTLAAVITGRAVGFNPRWIIMGASFSDRLVVPQTGPAFEQNAWVIGDGSEWGDPSTPGMAQLAKELIASDNRYWTENPDVGLTFGWAQARVMEAVLERAVQHNDLSHAGLVQAAAEIGAVDLGGLGSVIDYSKPLRLSAAKTTIFAVDGSYRNAIRVIAKYASTSADAYRPS